MAENSTAPLRTIARCQFGILSPDELRRMSVTEGECWARKNARVHFSPEQSKIMLILSCSLVSSFIRSHRSLIHSHRSLIRLLRLARSTAFIRSLTLELVGKGASSC